MSRYTPPGYERHIFVFGSNQAGRHGRGSALQARRHHGAIYGRGSGLQGDSYAIPTKDFNLRPLKLDIIQLFVTDFIAFAQSQPRWGFVVVRVGCGLAGFTDEEMVPLFAAARAVPNIHLDPIWKRMLSHE